VISGPSGAGKGTVIALVKNTLAHVVTSVSATTRGPRPGETDGREYRFLQREAFEHGVAAGEFLEWVEYSGNLYGTLRADVEAKLEDGDDVILEIELVGARAVRKTVPEAVSVFIAPPSMAELAQRLRGRGTETDEAIARRLSIAQTEVAAAGEFDHIVINDDAARAAAEVAAIIVDRRKGT
jgi:guanylate kinase